MVNDFGGLGSSGNVQNLSDEEYAALETMGQRGKGLVSKVFAAIAGRKVSFGDVRFNEVAPEDLDLTFRGSYLLVEAELAVASGMALPCITLINKEEIGLLLGMETLDDEALEEQVTRLGDISEVIVDSFNLSLPAAGQTTPALHFDGIRQIEINDASMITDIIGMDGLVEVSYPMTEIAGGEAQVSHLTTFEFVRGLVEGHVHVPSREPTGVGNSGGFDFGGLGMGSGGFGKGGTDASALGGAFSGSDFGSNDPVPSIGDPPTVRPAQFGAFSGPDDQPAGSNIDLLMDVSLRITVELGRSTMSIREILDLGPGSVIELDKLAGEPVDILVNDRPIAKGEVVVVDENFGVRVTDIISPARRMAGLR